MKAYHQEQITAGQMAILLHATVATTAILFLPGITVRIAGRDAWFVPFLAGITGFFMVWLVLAIARLFPGRSLVQATNLALPWGIGRLFSVAFLFWLVHVNGLVVRQFAEFLNGTVMPLTPLSLLVGSILLIAVYTVILGLETLSRMAQILVFPSLLLALAITLLVLPEANLDRLRPVAAQGLLPVMQGAIPPAAWFSEMILLGMLWPRVVNPVQGELAAGGTVLSIVFLLVWTGATTLSVFGPLSGFLTFPFFSLGTYIRLGDFFERFDALIMVFWMGGLFVKMSVFLYAAATGWADWLSLPDYRPLVPALALLTAVLAITSVRTVPELTELLGGVLPLYALAVTFLVAGATAGAGWLCRTAGRGKER